MESTTGAPGDRRAVQPAALGLPRLAPGGFRVSAEISAHPMFSGIRGAADHHFTSRP